MRIWAEFDCYVERADSDEWPDVWMAGEERWLRPHHVSLTFKQSATGDGPMLTRASVTGQKRWANSRRLTDKGTWYTVGIWDGRSKVPEWLAPYISEALRRIQRVKS